MALNLERILGTITGKEALYRSDRNFQAIQTDVNDKLPTSHNTDVAAHDDIRQQINSLDANKANKIMGSAIDAVLQNGWTGSLKYRKNNLNQVEIFAPYPGLTVGTKTAATVIATLPIGYRPTDRVVVICNKGEITSNTATLALVISALGEIAVTINGATDLATGTALRFSSQYQGN